MGLSVRAFAARHGVAVRTVERWLGAGLLAGAVKTSRGWDIPAETRRPPASGGASTPPPAPPVTGGLAADGGALVASESSRAPVAMLPQGVSVASALEVLPAFVPLEVAVVLLGLPAAAVRRHAEELGARPWGHRGRLVVPASTIRAHAGL